MIYPVDVHKNVVNAKKLVGKDRTAVIVQLFLFANVALFFALRFVIGQLLRMDMVFVWIAQIVICIFAGIFIFRVFIFKEDEKIREYESSSSDSFSRYMNIRKDSEYSKRVGVHQINLYEYTNGCAACTICCKFGSNDNVKSRSTAQLINQLCGLVHSYNYEIRLEMLPEKFENSDEFRGYLNTINDVEDLVLGKTLREIAAHSLEMSKRYSNVTALYITIKTDGPYKRSELEVVVATFFKMLDESVTSFRSVTSLGMNELLEFYRDFSTVEAIDLSMTKALDMIEQLDSDYSKVINVYALITEDGRKLKNDSILEPVFYQNERSVMND